MNNLFTTLVTGLALLFTLNVQANPTYPDFLTNNFDEKTSNHGAGFLMDDLIFTASTVSGDVGDVVCVDVTVENFDNILSFQYSINFDPTVLQFTEAIDPENIDDLNFGQTDVANGNLSVSWFDNDVEGITVPDGTLLYQVCFEIISSSGDALVSFSGSPTGIEVVDGDENPITFQGNNGTVMTGGTNPLSVSANTVTAANGDNVCLTITANNFTNLTSFQYSMNFNPAVLMFDQTINSGNLTGLMFNANGASSGNLVVNWNSSTGVTLANGTALYQVCFDVIGAGGTSSTFAFSGNPTPIMVTNADAENVTLVSNSGGVTVSGGGGNNGTDFTVIAATPVGNVGDVVCVDVTVENFDDILSFQYSMNFNPALLEFVEVIDPENIEDLNFGETDVANGNLNVSWFDNDIMGITVPDGTLLYQVCFTVLGGNGVVPVTFSGNPTSIEVVDSNEDPVVFASVSGGINVGGSPPLPTLNVNAPNVTADNGDQVCLDIKVNGFTNLTSFQYNVTFNPAVLTFAQNMNSGNLMGLMFNNSGSAAGNLSVSWNSATGVTLPNNATIYQACFDVIGAGGTSSAYAISAGMAANVDGPINFTKTNGLVTVAMPNNGTDLIFTVETTPGNVGDQVCLDVSVENFNNVLSFQYSMNFDPALLQFDSVIDPETLDGLNFGESDVASGNLTVSWFDEDINGIDLPDNTVIYQVCFTILNDNGGSPIIVSFSGNPTQIEAVDGNEDPIVFVGTPGGIGDDGGSPDPTVTFRAPTVTANNGDQICVDIKVNGFNNIASFQYTMTFNPAVLTFNQNISSGNLPNLMFNNGGAGSGTLVVNWNNNGTGITLPNNTTIYQVCFDVIGAGGTSSPLTFSTNATATDGDGGNVVVNRVNGAINVMSANNGTDFIVTGSSENGEIGDEVCIDVTVQNFNNILSFQYSMNFDPSLLQFVEVIDPENIDGLNFGESSIANGNLTVNWFDEDVSGVTIPNGTLLYQVCFTILSGTNGTITSVGFSGSPTSIEVVDGNEDPVVFGSNNGSVTIGPAPQDAVNFIFPSVDATPGQTICIPLTTQNFNDVNSMQYTFCYDCDLLTFTEFTNENATLSNAGNINTSNPNPCEINLTWFDDDVNGETLPDNATIIEVCFQVNGSATAGQSTSLAICSSATTPIEIADENSNLIPFVVIPGAVNIIPAVNCLGPITITNTNVMNVSPCAGANNGNIDITDAGGNGTGANSYSWVNVANPNAVLATTQDLANVGAGTYQVTITGCVAPNVQTLTQQFTITEPTPITISVTPTPVDCNGNSTGAISTTVSGGSGMGYTYQWNPSTAIGPNPTGLPAGNYAVTVTDSQGCTSSFGPIIISQPNQPFTATASVTNAACNGETGSIMVNANGGTTAYTYTLGSGGTQSNPTFNSLAAGTYNITATDMNGCTVALPNLQITQPAPISITENNSTPDLGNCEGAIDIDIAGGNPGGFTYSWTGPSGPFSSQDISGLCGGEYCVTATDNVGGCTATFCKTLIQPLEIDLVSIQNACFNECNGSAIIDATGGDGSYTILWSPGNQMIINPADLCAGINTVTVTSGDGQTATLDVTIQAPTSAVVINSPVLTNPSSATQCNGSISISPAGGYGGPYAVTWSPPQAGTTTITALCAGTYATTVTDSNGCTTTASYTLESPELEIIDLASTPVSCSGNDDGTISFNVIGGTTPYSIAITGPTVVTPDPNPPYLYEGLSAGVYLITVTDGAGDVETTTVEIMGGGIITTEIIKVVDVTPSSLGSIQIAQPTGGTPPYTYTWSGGPNINAMNPDNLNPGVYSLTIEDANECFVILENFATVYELEVINVVTVNPPCSNNPVGSITVEVTEVANNLPFVFVWENSNGNPVGINSPILSDVPSGTYTLTVTDSCGTSFDEIYVLVADSNLDLDVNATSFFNGFNVRCNGGSSGQAEAMPSNGSLPYSYEWSNGGMNATINNVNAGTYSVTVTDNVGCTAESAITLTQPAPININFNIDSISCNGQGDGFINAVVSGGVATGGYNYFWNNGDADNTVGPVGPGNYTVEVTDGNDCEVEASVALSEPEELDFTFTTTPVTETELGSITLFPTGGTEPYFYTWPAGIVGENMITDLNFGKYAVIVTDANGCTKMNTGIQVQLNTDCFQGSTVITPNDDSLNDVFKVTCSERIKNLEIFNRWGQLVYEAETYSDEWDGTTRRGSEVPEGTYFYVFEYLDVNTNETEQVRGSVTLLRN